MEAAVRRSSPRDRRTESGAEARVQPSPALPPESQRSVRAQVVQHIGDCPAGVGLRHQHHGLSGLHAALNHELVPCVPEELSSRWIALAEPAKEQLLALSDLPCALP